MDNINSLSFLRSMEVIVGLTKYKQRILIQYSASRIVILFQGGGTVVFKSGLGAVSVLL